MPSPDRLRHALLLTLVATLCSFVLVPATDAAAEDYPTLATIQSAAGDSGWTAGTNPIWNLTWRQKAKYLGLILPTTLDDPGPRSHVAPLDSLPTSWDWRNVSGRSYVSSVKDQDTCGSCWAFAACGALESLREIHNDTGCAIENLSEQFLVSCCKANSGCDGGNPSKTANCLRDTGTVDEACFPYTASNQSCNNSCSDWQSRIRDISGWSWASTYPRFPTISELKSAVKQAPVWTTFMVYADFYAYKSGVYRHVVGPLVGGHAVLMVGYNDSTKSFTCKNSWSSSWGENGYFRVGYSQIPPGGCQFGRWTQNYTVGLTACLPYDPDDTGEYNWESVAGPPAVTGDDELVPVTTPFNIKYFCSGQSDATISTNGWVAMGDYTGPAWYAHSMIPSEDGPPRMVAPLWTDLVASTRSSGVYYEYRGDDTFVIEYREMGHIQDPTALETFQVIFYDPAVYPTPTGDAKIKFQYYQHSPSIDEYPGYTVGVENEAQTCGTQYYTNYDPRRRVGKDGLLNLEGIRSQGYPVHDGLAIEFTAIPDGENDVIPAPPSGLTAVYDEPSATLNWTAPLYDTKGFDLDFLDGAIIECDEEAIATGKCEPGEPMECSYRELKTGYHDYDVRAYIGAMRSDSAAVQLEIPARTDYSDHDVGNVRFTVTDQGICGYMDGAHSAGSGFRYGATEDSWLFVGSLWAGTDTTYALNRDFDQDPRADWMFWNDVESPVPALSDQDYLAVFDDGGHALPRHLLVTQRSLSWGDEPYDDFVILDYEVKNAGDDVIEGLYVGQYMDWDIPPGNGGGNSAGTDSLLQLVYMWRDAGYPYVGVALLETDPGLEPPVANLTVIYNPTFVYPEEYVLDRDRYLFLSAADPDHAVSQMTEPADWSALASAGPFDIDPGLSEAVPFAVVGGDDYADLVANVARAQEIYSALSVDVPEDESVEYALELGQNRPNPFNPMTSIRYALPEPGHVKLAVYDAAGRLVATLVDGETKAGPHATAWDSRNDDGVTVASGVYFCRLEAGGKTLTRKMVLLK